MRKASLVILTLISFAIVRSSFAYVGAISIQDLVQKSEVIVVARVIAATPPPVDDYAVRTARATILAVWKGPATLKQVEFVASPTWTCDIADAKIGETAILFLGRDEEQKAFVIMHAGRGRMPIDESGSERLAAIWPDVLLPRGTRTQSGPEPEYTFIRSISVAQLEKIVRSCIASAKTDHPLS